VELQLNAGPAITHVIPSDRDAAMWLCSVLTVSLPQTDANRRPGAGRAPRTEWGFYRYMDRVFPTGLLSYVVQQAQKDRVTVSLNWEPGAVRLPIVHDPADVAWPKQYEIRNYQFDLVREALGAGRGIMWAATGSGKTGMMGMILRCLGTPRALVVVGSVSLVKQTRTELSAWLDAEVGEVSRNKRVTTPNVVVALVHSLAARAGEEWAQELLASSRVIMLDECHHCARGGKRGKDGRIAGGRWYVLAQSCTAGNRYGVSATPLKIGDPVQNCRLIGATGPVFETSISSTDLIQAGYSARPHIFFLKHHASRLPQRLKWGDELEKVPKGKKVARADRRVVTKGAYTLGIVESYARNERAAGAATDLYDMGLKVLLIVERLEHGKALHGMLTAWGVTCRFIHGGLDQDGQEARLAWLREPGARVMVSTRVLGEGTDVPDLGAVVVARGGKAFVALFQNIGRATRPKGTDDPGSCVVVFMDDDHHHYFKKHVDLLRMYLASEPGYYVAEEGQTLAQYARSVLGITATPGGPVTDQFPVGKPNHGAGE